MVNLTANHAPQTVTDYTTFSYFEFSPAGRSDCTLRASFYREQTKKQQFINNKQKRDIWLKVDPQAAAAASGEEDITEGGDNQGGGNNNNPPSGELDG